MSPPLRCPECATETMVPRMTTTGVELDACSSCSSVWFDRGEVFFFVDDVSSFARSVDEARRAAVPSDKDCPHGGSPMVALDLQQGGQAYLDQRSGGIWISAEGAQSLAYKPRRRLEWANPARSRLTQRKALPSLVLHSFFTIAGLYTVMTLALIGASLYLGLEPGLALALSAVFLLLQFLFGPLIMDLTMPWLYRVEWISVRELPAHLQDFLSTACEKEDLKLPKFGLIPDLAPNAFTYGHTPNNARVVITEGILELLDPKEVEAVVGHELGHARNWDMALMTAAQLVPMVLYYLYRTLLDWGRGSRNQVGAVSIGVAVGAYILYFISELVVLAFSRTREYYADRIGAALCGSPKALASALVKIAYGLASREEAQKETQDEEDDEPRRRPLSAIGALGIFNGDNARAMAVLGGAGARSGDAARDESGGYGINPDTLQGAMKWDLWNPWAKFYELQSTHPLVAKRILHLSALSASRDEEPLVRFNLVQPESYWDEFFTDVLVKFGPLIVGLGSALVIGLGGLDPMRWAGPAILGVSGAMILKLRFRYPMKAFPEMSVATLLRQVKVSDIRPIACRLKGSVRGKGVPGLVWGDDFVMQDDTGIIFLDHRQPFAFWEMLWGWFRGDKLVGGKVEVDGWYHRSPIPYVEIHTFTVNGIQRKSYLRVFKWMSAVAALVVGMVLSLSLLA